ncbi:hypothetical protein LBMAG42_40960 [Deltaproteobacteria bacterium]|nr:hypothetical protein LBMAG42_40960 [Deltaproteobacteria bacterium]
MLLPTLNEGPLARVELSMRREENAALNEPLIGVLVEGMGARLRADPRVLDGGVRVDAGCSSARCILALDGLASGVDAALPALAEALAGPAVKVRGPTVRALKRQWRGAWRVPPRLLDAGLRGEPGAAGPKPRFRPRDLRAAWGALVAPGVWSELAAAGAYDEAAVRSAAIGLGWSASVPALPSSPSSGTLESAPSNLPSPALTLVDWPGATRAQIGLAWAHTDADAVRERLLAGDFQSSLVQRLRERDAFTYDVTPEFGPTWAGASFDVATDAAIPALTAALSEVSHLEATDPATIAGATLRQQSALAGLDDTLAGRLALRHLPPAPSEPPLALAPVDLLRVVVIGDAELLEGPLRASFPAFPLTKIDRCTLMYAGPCPPSW